MNKEQTKQVFVTVSFVPTVPYSTIFNTALPLVAAEVLEINGKLKNKNTLH